jgi:hypothetical protein
MQEFDMGLATSVSGFSLAAFVGLVVQLIKGRATLVDHMVVFLVVLLLAARIVLFLEDLVENTKKEKEREEITRSSGVAQSSAVVSDTSILEGVLEFAEASVAVVVGFTWLAQFRSTYDEFVFIFAEGEESPDHDDAVWVEEEGEEETLSSKQIAFAFIWFGLLWLIALFAYSSAVRRLAQPEPVEEKKSVCMRWRGSKFNPMFWLNMGVDGCAWLACARCGYRSTRWGEQESGEDDAQARRMALKRKRRSKRKQSELLLGALSLALGAAAEKVRARVLFAQRVFHLTQTRT